MLKEGCNLNKEKFSIRYSAVRFENRLREPAGFAGLSVREAKPTYFSRWLFSHHGTSVEWLFTKPTK
jgi:hypothetical protein